MTSGRKTFAEDLPPQGPIVAFDVALESVRDHTRALSRAVGAVEFFAAWSAADGLRNALSFAAALAATARLPPRADAMQRLEDVKAVAESMLAFAPAPALELIAAATSIDPCARRDWESYKRRWKASCSGIEDPRPALRSPDRE